MVIEYAEDRLGFKPTKELKGIDLANEFCRWAKENGHEDLIIDLAKEIGYH